MDRFALQLSKALATQQRKGFDIILDAVSGEYFSPGFNALSPGGRYVIYGAANWTPTGAPICASYPRSPHAIHCCAHITRLLL
jgi:NADPH:quinone reductase-like Zn-dependent oxidoreductase